METSQWVVLGAGGTALLLGIVLAVLGYRGRKKLACMEATPTVTAADAAKMCMSTPGARVEVVGLAEAEQPLSSPTAQMPCVYYRYKLEHRVQERVRDESTGAWRYEESWETVDEREEAVPFYVRDSSGTCLVYPDGADFAAETRTQEGYGDGRDYLSSSGLAEGILEGILGSLGGRSESVIGYRVTESVISVGQPVYVLGSARRSGETASLGKGDGPFIISNKMEEELSRKYKRSSTLQYAFACVLAMGGVAAMVYSAFM